jgi:hypothetical protein
METTSAWKLWSAILLVIALSTLAITVATRGEVVDKGDLSVDRRPAFAGTVDDVALQPDGRLIIAGPFAAISGVMRSGLARLHPNGRIDWSFDPLVSGAVSWVVLDQGGKVLIGGSFTDVSGVRRDGLARLDEDGLARLEF